MTPAVRSRAALLALLWVGCAGAQSFTLSVGTLANGDRMSRQQVYGGCGGADLSPQLRWSGAPAATRSYAVTVRDPDARGGRGWWHWLAYDIAPGLTRLDEGAGKAGAAGMTQVANDFGHQRYDGPCPPSGPAHHYVFTVYALDVAHLETAGDSAAVVDRAIRRHALASARQTFLYGR